MPVPDRHFSSVALKRASGLLLFDCGEGTQTQLIRARLHGTRLEAIFITHLHGDHVFGLMGLLSTLALVKYQNQLTLVGPYGLQEFVMGMPQTGRGSLPYQIAFVELDEEFEHQVVFRKKDYWVEARPIEHSAFTIGYRYQEEPRPGNLNVERARALGITDFMQYRMLKAGLPITLADGRTIQPDTLVSPSRPGAIFAYVTDTRPCTNGCILGRQADILYHEATFTNEHQDRALETRHSTAQEAAQIATEAEAKRLLISHYSARYKTADTLVSEARQIFKNTDAAIELNSYPL